MPAQPVAQVIDEWKLIAEIDHASAARAIVLAIFAGLAGQLLFVGQRGGINVLVWVGLVLLGALVVRRPGARLDRLDLWLPWSALVFAAFIALRDEAMLFLFDLPAAGALTLASVVALGGYPLTRRSAGAVARAGAMAIVVASIGAGFLGTGVRPLASRLALRDSPLLGAVVRGLLLAVPLLLIFLALFSAADAVFDAQLRAITRFGIDADELITRLLFAFLAGWVFAGTLAATWLVQRPLAAAADEAAASGWRIGRVEALVVLVLLNVVFALFVAVQAAYLFGGLDTLAVSGLTYADYARRGFFELVAVAALVGLVILVVGRRVAQPGWAVRLAAIALALLTGAILVSAAYRMSLYQAAYGWTELRFYVLAAILWLAVCLVAAIVALASARTGWLLRAALAAGLLVAIGANAIAPQAFVTARNVERTIDPSLVAEGGWTGLDVEYISWLGADAVPVLVQAHDRLPLAERAEVERVLRGWANELRGQSATGGWPSWNLSRVVALEALTGAGY